MVKVLDISMPKEFLVFDCNVVDVTNHKVCQS